MIREFNCRSNKYSAVSNVVRKIKNKLAESNRLSKLTTWIREKLFLEQRKTSPPFDFFSKGETLSGEMRVTQDTVWHMPPNKERSLMLAKRQLSELVCDAVNLEGIPFTLPEIQTLLDGITVGGHKVADQEIALNQANGWRTLFRWVEQGDFSMSEQKACDLHAIAGKNESLAWGKFRTGSVTIAGTDYMPPNSEELPLLFESLIDELPKIIDIYDRAIHVFLFMAKNQFFYDVNKRMGRFMMNGLLLSEGYPAINLPAKRQLEFNNLMLAFYQTGQQKPMNLFLRSCLDERMIKIMKEA